INPCVNKKDSLILIKIKNQEYIIKTKRKLLSLVAILFPWAIIFSDDNPLGAFLALAMQVTLIGWIPAVMWAWKIVHRVPEEKPVTVKPPPKASPQKPKSATTSKGTK
ncbi:MAG: YqaE/Pmp3 family membrane protein, partial [Gammaproteobacteria bacterium]